MVATYSLSSALHPHLSFNTTKECVEGKLDKSKVPAKRLEAFNAEDPFLKWQSLMFQYLAKYQSVHAYYIL